MAMGSAGTQGWIREDQATHLLSIRSPRRSGSDSVLCVFRGVDMLVCVLVSWCLVKECGVSWAIWIGHDIGYDKE